MLKKREILSSKVYELKKRLLMNKKSPVVRCITATSQELHALGFGALSLVFTSDASTSASISASTRARISLSKRARRKHKRCLCLRYVGFHLTLMSYACAYACACACVASENQALLLALDVTETVKR